MITGKTMPTRERDVEQRQNLTLILLVIFTSLFLYCKSVEGATLRFIILFSCIMFKNRLNTRKKDISMLFLLPNTFNMTFADDHKQ